ncbi:MAG: serine/threonine-protein kinase [Myxococcota bacterium]
MDPRSLSRIGRYDVVRYVDEGAFAWVFEVRDLDPVFAGRRLALKMLKPEAARGDEFQRFKNEAAWLARIEHPNVVAIYDFGQDDETGNYYYAMSFVDGPTLKMRLKERGPLGVDEALRLFDGLLDGLEALHANQIVHRDIKPANVLLDSRGIARLGDLGIAREQTASSQTRTGVAVGTALYMSPEQARGRPVDARSDLFSLALTLYEALTGNVVYDHVESIDSTSGMEVLMYIGSLVMNRSEFDVRFPKEAGVPRAVQDVLRRALRIAPDDRYASAAEMRAALREAAAPAPVAQPRHAGPPPWAIAAALVLLLALAGGAYALFRSRELASLREAAAEARETTRAHRERALAAVRAAADLGPDAAIGAAALGPVVERAELLVSKATDDLMRGEQTLEAGAAEGDAQKLSFAQQRFADARAALDDACEIVADEALAAQTEASLARAREAGARLVEAGAPEVAGDAWTALSDDIAKLGQAPTAAGCALADARAARAARGASALATAAELERGLPAAWERAANEAHASARAADEAADGPGLDDATYLRAYRTAKLGLVRGERAQRAGDFRAARGLFATASADFENAAAIAAAARPKLRAERAIEALRERGGDAGRAPFLLAEGNEAMGAEDWPRAAGLFAQAADELERALGAEAGGAGGREGATAP